MRWSDRIVGRIKGALSGGEEELGREDLLRKVEDGLLALRRHGAGGREVFPPGVRVTVTVAEGSVHTLRTFVEEPTFERELEARLRNRLVAPGPLPARRYVFEAGAAPRVEVQEDDSLLLAVLVVEGGDADGSRVVVDLGRKEIRLGRGRWHAEAQGDQRLLNDLVVTEEARFVSRAAAVIRRVGSLLELEPRAQGDFLLVIQKDGNQVRPALTASGKVRLQPGDRLDFHDGGAQHIHVRVEGEQAC